MIQKQLERLSVIEIHHFLETLYPLIHFLLHIVLFQKLNQVFSHSSIYSFIYLPLKLLLGIETIIAELEDIEIDKYSPKSSSAQHVSWNSSTYYNTINVDEGMMEREDFRAEQQAETAIRITDPLPERKGIIQTQSSFFNDQESDSDDEKSNKLQKKIDRKTMQQILRQHSGNDIKVDSTNEKDGNEPVEGKTSDNLSNGDIIGGEPDCEEEFVFQ